MFQQWQQQCEKQAIFQTSMQIFMVTACRLLLITGENGGDYVEKIIFGA